VENIIYFLAGIAAIIVFLIGTSGIFLLAPGFALKGILTVGFGIGLIFFFMWLFPDFTFSGSRKELESGFNDLYESIVNVGENAESDLFGNFRRNRWVREQKRKNESGYYRDNNGLKYYNASQDKLYYQLPNGRWQEYGLWNTSIDNPFEISEWISIINIEEISGYWIGTNNIHFPEVRNLNPEFTALFTMTLRNRNDLIDIGFKLDMENYLNALLVAYPDHFNNKNDIWTLFTENSRKKTSAIDYGDYYISSFSESIPLDNILMNCIIQINNDSTKIKAIIPQNVFGIAGTDTLECILDKE